MSHVHYYSYKKGENEVQCKYEDCSYAITGPSHCEPHSFKKKVNGGISRKCIKCGWMLRTRKE